MGEVLQDFGLGGGQRPDLRNVLQVSHSGNYLVRIGDLGDDPQDWAYHWGIPPQGGPLSRGYASTAQNNGAVVLPTFGGGDSGSGYRVGGDIHPFIME